MKHRRQHLLLLAAAAVAIGVAPAWSPMAIADEAAAPDDTSTSAEITEPSLATDPGEAADRAEPADATIPAERSTSDSSPADDVTDPVAEDPVPGKESATAEEPGDEGGHEGGGHGEGGTLPDGVTVTVDGRNIQATDPEGSLPKIASCTFDVVASGLTTEPPDTVGIRIVAWPPTAPGESRVKLVDITETSVDGAWAGGFPLDEAVQQFDRKGNGYHMRFEFLINDDVVAMKMYWLGCGEPQTGNPRRMLFDVQWYDADGTLLTTALDSALPAGWRQGFVLDAAGERGTVECTYPPGSDLLSCQYVNPGHGDQPGLVLPGKPGTSYTVDVTGEPRRWVVDDETVGSFLADDTCPKGGGHDDGHEETTAAVTRAEGEDGDGEHAACVHTVAINQLAVVTPPDEGNDGNANPPDTGGGGNANPTEGNAAALPTTGANSLPLIPAGLVLLALGGVLIVSSRPPRPVLNR